MEGWVTQSEPAEQNKRVGRLFQAKSFQRRLSKLILDEIDRVLAAHYGFTDEGLDFIPSAQLRAGPSTRLRTGPSAQLRAGNYDIKYRMGREAENEEE